MQLAISNNKHFSHEKFCILHIISPSLYESRAEATAFGGISDGNTH